MNGVLDVPVTAVASSGKGGSQSEGDSLGVYVAPLTADGEPRRGAPSRGAAGPVGWRALRGTFARWNGHTLP
ncbi:hypothetical protein GCM10010331_12060 [Streptomyces xanthochromogenes]|nr:hypothetical protein GCM10010331_12060 [Streptomyces xanthochromogenes]